MTRFEDRYPLDEPLTGKAAEDRKAQARTRWSAWPSSRSKGTRTSSTAPKSRSQNCDDATSPIANDARRSNETIQASKHRRFRVPMIQNAIL